MTDPRAPGPPATGTAPAPAPGAPPRGGGPAPHHGDMPWPEARSIAARAGQRGWSAAEGAPSVTALDDALGLVLAEPLTALTDLPPFDTSAMDGWAVAGPGPWELRDEHLLAGRAEPAPLVDGDAVRIATGARVPREATAVLRSEHGHADDRGRLHALREVGHGQDIRPRGQECHTGEPLLPPGTTITPAVLGLAAATGYDELLTLARPRVQVLVLGDELLTEGIPRAGLIRDALGPMLPHWARALGAEVCAVHRLGDDAGKLLRAVADSDAELLITTGGTASGPVDHVHPTLRALDAELLVDGVAVRPGHPMLLARLDGGRHLVGLPGNPLAAVSGLVTLAAPLLRGLRGRRSPHGRTAVLRDPVQGHPADTRLVPVVLSDGRAVPLHYNGPAMLRGIAVADGLAVVPPGGAGAGRELAVLDLPWTGAGKTGSGECFT
ncbi:molybdopterin molybdotransferase MoeA [Streptomyces sp. NPDC050560]|uniref:molybdopterin molybdotransferase MoeA n=1 Tax=Streptomyces sp. NPDC050560 TaxID=3365630 RepID=UPI0037BCF5CC